MNIFYTPDLDSGVLSEEESKHAIKVLRMTVGEEFIAIDGNGTRAQCRISDIHSKRCHFETIESELIPNPVVAPIHIAIAPTKSNDRFEWFLEKATEIGVTEITPLLCANSERRVIKPERYHKILVAAMKQSQRSHLPKLNPLTECQEFIQENQGGYIAHCAESPKQDLKSAYKAGQAVIIIIGPEGDFDPKEIAMAIENNWIPVSLGASRLRTETAGIVACHTIQLVNQN